MVRLKRSQWYEFQNSNLLKILKTLFLDLFQAVYDQNKLQKKTIAFLNYLLRSNPSGLESAKVSQGATSRKRSTLRNHTTINPVSQSSEFSPSIQSHSKSPSRARDSCLSRASPFFLEDLDSLLSFLRCQSPWASALFSQFSPKTETTAQIAKVSVLQCWKMLF